MAYWVSEQGDRYHLNPDCRSLRAGETSADAQEGYQVHAVQRIESLEEAIAKALTGQPCRARDCQAPSAVQQSGTATSVAADDRREPPMLV